MAGDIGLSVQNYKQGKKEFSLPGTIEQRLCTNLDQSYIQSGGTLPENTTVTLKWLIRSAKKGDPAAKKLMRSILEEIAVVLTNTILVLNPELVILGGTAAYFSEDDVKLLTDFLKANTPYPPQVYTSKLLERSGIYGAIRTAIDHAETFLAELWK